MPRIYIIVLTTFDSFILMWVFVLFFFLQGNKTDACNKIMSITKNFMYNDWISIKFVRWDSVVGIMTRLQAG
jgi:hypothetical protein